MPEIVADFHIENIEKNKSDFYRERKIDGQE